MTIGHPRARADPHSLAPLAAGRPGELNSVARLASRSTKTMPADTSPSPPFRGEMEGPDPPGWEGEVGGATNRPVGPPPPTLSPRPANAARERVRARGLFTIT